MKALSALRSLSSLSPKPHNKTSLRPSLVLRFFSAEPQPDLPKGASTDSSDAEINDSVFDSTHYELPDSASASASDASRQPTWDDKYRAEADRRIFGRETQKRDLRVVEKEEDRRPRVLAKALLEYALARADDDEEEEEDEEGVVKEEDQKSLSVGIIGAPNAGKSSLTNYLVGTKVAAVSRKTNTTTHEVLGVMRKGDTQINLFDTPGITLNKKVRSYKTDIRDRAQSVMNVIDLYDVLIVIFDVHRHLTRPDKRVTSLIERVGEKVHPTQKRVLCMNKVDLVEKKKQLLKVSDQFKDLPGYEKFFMISGMKGSGVNDLTNYLMDQAVKRPWDEDSLNMSEEAMKSISLEVVRERLLDHVHKEIPYTIEHRLTDWKELRDGSLKIEHHFITNKESQRKILVGAKGSKIGKIGMEANEELRSIFGRNVHLILKVRLER